MDTVYNSKSQTNTSVLLRYSNAFKLQVVSEIESGKLSISLAQKKYQIKGGETIQNWLKKFGKNHLLNKVVRVESLDERDQVKALEKKVKDLQAALADSQVKLFAMESLVAVSEEYTGLDLKKNFGHKLSSTQKKGLKGPKN